MQLIPDELEDIIVETEVDDYVNFESRVILFNDEIHTFEEVVRQIIKAISCSLEKAEELTLKVHTHGKATIYEGRIAESLRVSSVLEEIGLITRIEC